MGSLLNLHLYLPIKDVRKLIYAKLDEWDRALVKAAHGFGSTDVQSIYRDVEFQQNCAFKGYLSLLQHIGDKISVNPGICAAAAKGGNLHVLQWARKNGCPWDNRTCSYAAGGGYLHVVQWARENVCPWDEATCEYAAVSGHLNVLQWARENGCPWDKWTCSGAALRGHLHVLQWARVNGCPWNELTCAYAARYGHLHVLHWARANGCPEW
jgi:hypothetical protein